MIAAITGYGFGVFINSEVILLSEGDGITRLFRLLEVTRLLTLFLVVIVLILVQVDLQVCTTFRIRHKPTQVKMVRSQPSLQTLRSPLSVSFLHEVLFFEDRSVAIASLVRRR